MYLQFYTSAVFVPFNGTNFSFVNDDIFSFGPKDLCFASELVFRLSTNVHLDQEKKERNIYFIIIC